MGALMVLNQVAPLALDERLPPRRVYRPTAIVPVDVDVCPREQVVLVPLGAFAVFPRVSADVAELGATKAGLFPLVLVKWWGGWSRWRGPATCVRVLLM